MRKKKFSKEHFYKKLGYQVASDLQKFFDESHGAFTSVQELANSFQQLEQCSLAMRKQLYELQQ